MLFKKHSVFRTAVCFLAVSMLFSAFLGFSASAAEQGTCGKNLKWSYSAGTLTITGKGEMQNYSEESLPPWYHLRENISSVRLSNSVSSIGTLAFYDFSSLKAISLPDSVQRISDKAFYNCKSLCLVDFSQNLKSIGRSAFYQCEKLESVMFPEGLEIISDKAFYLCRSLTNVLIPKNVKTIGKQAFAYCENLVRVEILSSVQSIPEWCFYGCENLSQIALPASVKTVESYAFKQCDALYTIYYEGTKEQANSIRSQIAEDLPNFINSGYISSGDMEEETTTSRVENDSSGSLTSQTNTTVLTGEAMNLVIRVSTGKSATGKLCYSVHMILTVENNEAWSKAISSVRAALSDMNTRYSLSHQLLENKLSLYLNHGTTVNKAFLQELAGRNMVLEVLEADGSFWCVDCRELKSDGLKQDVNFNFTVTEGSDKSNDALGTDSSFELKFDSSSEMDTYIVVPLPKENAGTNAFLYQIESFGKHKKLQATKVDEEGNAYFYLSSVDKKTKYVIGINVPGEETDDVIIADKASDPFGAIYRLEKIDYAVTGHRRILGFTILEMMLITIGALVFLSVLVGFIVYLKFKKSGQTFQPKENVKKKK